MHRVLLLKRASLWAAGLFLLLGTYVLGAPVVAGVVQARFPIAEPAAKVFYAPLIFYAQRPDLPGSQWFAVYAREVEGQVMRTLR